MPPPGLTALPALFSSRWRAAGIVAAQQLRRCLSSQPPSSVPAPQPPSDALVPVSRPAPGSSGEGAAYTITEAPVEGAARGGAKWGRFVLKNITGHTKKLNPVARQVRACARGCTVGRHGAAPDDAIITTPPLLAYPPQIVGLSVNEALAQMSFHVKRRGKAVGMAVERAAWNADFHHDVRREALMVDQAWTGKQLQMPRIRYHSKGRAGRSHYRTSMLTVRLREMTPEERAKRRSFTKPTPEARAALSPRGY